MDIQFKRHSTTKIDKTLVYFGIRTFYHSREESSAAVRI